MPRDYTHLMEWLDARHVVHADFARQAGISPRALRYILAGRNIPTLATAFQIERLTEGQIPASIWLERSTKPRGKR